MNQKFQLIGVCSGADLTSGMLVSKSVTDRMPEVVGPLTGACEKGAHFAGNCYDRIGQWLVWDEAKKNGWMDAPRSDTALDRVLLFGLYLNSVDSEQRIRPGNERVA